MVFYSEEERGNIIQLLEAKNPLLGKPGFEIPSEIAQMRWESLPGNNNWVVSGASDGFDGNRSFNVAGDARDNLIWIAPGCRFHGRVLLHGNENAAIFLGSKTGNHPVNVHFASDRQTFFWGEDCTSNTVTFELGFDGTAILVGRDCMFSAYIHVKTSDDHAIVDLDTGLQVNTGADIVIEPHVWVGLNSLILKGVRIGAGSIVAANAVVTKDVPKRTAVAGIPAKAVRRNCTWLRDRVVPPGSELNLTRLLGE